MNYYDRDKNKIKFNTINMKCIGKGTCGKVYKHNNNAVKIYYNDTAEFLRLKPERFDLFKSITNPHFIKLKNIYRKNPSPFDKNKEFVTAAYETAYYQEDKTSIIEKPMDYLLDNLSELEILLTYFTSEHILTDDLKYCNTILCKNDIVLIDPDNYRIYKDSLRYIALRNKENLLNLTNSILYNSLKDYDKNLLKDINVQLIKFNVHESTNVTYQVSKVLKKYKTLRDYYMDNLK